MEYIAADQCCDDCTDDQKCGNVLIELSEIQGSLMFDHCECECAENQKRMDLREALHADPDIDRSTAEFVGEADDEAEDESEAEAESEEEPSKEE